MRTHLRMVIDLCYMNKLLDCTIHSYIDLGHYILGGSVRNAITIMVKRECLHFVCVLFVECTEFDREGY